jgi:membrane-bound lytic murein transglycosylase F
MLNLRGGVISHYDKLFQQYSRPIGWDWRLMAAQCYQESTFDPEAKSWAGARGLMQIMPSTADHLGLARKDMHDPEKNIAAASRYLKELEAQFSDIHDRFERQNFVLAAYNGGYHHIRDAMTLARRDGCNPKRWDDVGQYVLRLSEPRYYRDSLVKHGYMRGSETFGYVKSIRERWKLYRTRHSRLR